MFRPSGRLSWPATTPRSLLLRQLQPLLRGCGESSSCWQSLERRGSMGSSQPSCRGGHGEGTCQALPEPHAAPDGLGLLSGLPQPSLCLSVPEGNKTPLASPERLLREGKQPAAPSLPSPEHLPPHSPPPNSGLPEAAWERAPYICILKAFTKPPPPAAEQISAFNKGCVSPMSWPPSNSR